VFFLGIIYISLKLICYISQFLHTVHYNYILFFLIHIFIMILYCSVLNLIYQKIIYYMILRILS
jgi:hypothetical protein